jgi:hypothetical protein
MLPFALGKRASKAQAQDASGYDYYEYQKFRVSRCLMQLRADTKLVGCYTSGRSRATKTRRYQDKMDPGFSYCQGRHPANCQHRACQGR